MKSTFVEKKKIVTVVLDEDSFRSAITRERKRAERSGLAIALILISTGECDRYDQASELWRSVTEGVGAIQSDIDIVGWFQGGRVLGLLAPDILPSELVDVCKRIEGQLRKEFTVRLDSERAKSLALRLRVHPETIQSEEEATQLIDSYLYPELHSSPIQATRYELVKRGLDFVGSLTLLVLLAPFMALIALSVRMTSPGPVIFRQVRIGRMMQPFMICKFRTMRANADPGIHHHYVSWFITSSDKSAGQDKNQVFKLTGDPRITPIGHFLRKTSLDELPQLWNVLKGEMSLVGPRPPLWYELQQYQPWHRHRVLEAKPGITGLWQVSGRSRTTFDEMVRLDLRYAKSKSIWTDIKILLATPFAVISGKGAG